MRFLIAILLFLSTETLAYSQSFIGVDLHDARVCPAESTDITPPDFAAERCETMSLLEVDPQGRFIWMQTRLTLAPADIPQDQPLGFYVSGAMSTQVWINGQSIGANGAPGINRSAERAGQMDAVLFVPPDRLQPGDNTVVMLLSSHHGPVSFANPIHYLMLGEFAGPTERILRAYWPSLINLGVYVIGFFIFGFMAFRSEDRESALILTLMALFISFQLIAETSRGLFGYAYPLHAWRLFAVVGLGLAFGCFVLAYVLKAFSGWRVTTRWGLTAIVAIITLGVIMITPSYDPKAMQALVLPIGTAMAGLCWWSWKGQKKARLYLAIFAALMISAFVALHAFIDISIYYFASILMFLAFFDSAAGLVRARRQARREMARSERLEMALEQARLKSEPVTLQLNRAGQMEKLNTAEIVHLAAAGDYVEIHFANGGQTLYTARLNEIENRLPETFLRVHRSHIVNTAFVVRLSREASGVGELSLSTSAHIPVSRRIMPKVRSALAG
ncbi:LytTR family transcriptional regulator DNA-binding domain-containing protein [Hyphobacterium sp.]|uniref:LytTR family transcriptional regulator DNA-binding domain-containing protein n=1 Tax=Hyphobacterium sp. TaxID=2004662 RepID=UPI003BA89CA3